MRSPDFSHAVSLSRGDNESENSHVLSILNIVYLNVI
jgi:hypothetical protein